MRAGGSKKKGAEFERVICRQLSLWLTGGKHDDALWRSAMSGGRFTVTQKAGKSSGSQAGDISAIGKAGIEFMENHIIEVKFYKSLELDRLFFTEKANFSQFWRQAIRDAKLAEKRPVLIAKQNYRQPLIAFDDDVLWDLRRFGATNRIKPIIVPELKANITLLKTFLDKVDPKWLVEDD